MDGTELRVLITEQEIERRVTELGTEIGAVYPEDPLCLVGVLKGACIFLADLVRTIPRPVSFDFVGASSYGSGMVSSGEVALVHDVSADIRGSHVLIVEDIVDTGITLRFLRDHLKARRPKTLRTVALLDKAERRRVDAPVEFAGFRIPNEFVVGYGMDLDERYRDLRDIRVFDGAEE